MLQVEVVTSADRNLTSSPSHRPMNSHTSTRAQSSDEMLNESQPLIDPEVDQRTNVSSYYEITEIVEMGKMSSIFFNRSGRNLFYICLVIYLYGDLAIYGAAVSKSVRDVACTFRPANSTSPLNMSDNVQCWEWSDKSRLDMYRIILAIFTCTIGQFVFCNVTKTKYLQVMTTVMR